MEQDERIKKLQIELENLKDELEQFGVEATSKAKDKAEEYKKMAEKKAEEFYNQAKYSGKKIDKFAHEHPYQWMAIGVGVGLLLGTMMGMKSKDKMS